MSASESRTLRDHLARLGLAEQAGLLVGVVLSACLLISPAAWAVSGFDGLLAAGVAAAVCLAGAVLALLLTTLFRGPSAAMYSLALGMLARTLIPLLAGVGLHLGVPRLAAAGMIYYLLAFYLLGLAVETTLLLAKIPAPRAPAPWPRKTV